MILKLFNAIYGPEASGGDGIPVELLKSLKTMLLKCCTQYVNSFGKLSSSHKTGKGLSFLSRIEFYLCLNEVFI